MKLRQIINEDKEEKFWDDKFEPYAGKTRITMTKTSDGWNFEPQLVAKENKTFPELPYKINKVLGKCDLDGVHLENLNNTPNECNRLSLAFNKISSVATSHLIKTTSLNLTGNPIVNLQGLQVSDLSQLSLSECEFLETLDGLQNIKVKNLILEDCPNFKDDLYKYKDNIESVDIDPSNTPNMPLVLMIIHGKPRIDPKEMKNSELQTIIQKYWEKGPREIFDLIRDLRDKGFNKAAQIK